jgi:hypothetical protein
MKKILLSLSFVIACFAGGILTISEYRSHTVENIKVNAIRHELAVLIRGMADEENDKLHKDVYNKEANELDK